MTPFPFGIVNTRYTKKDEKKNTSVFEFVLFFLSLAGGDRQLACVPPCQYLCGCELDVHSPVPLAKGSEPDTRHFECFHTTFIYPPKGCCESLLLLTTLKKPQDSRRLPHQYYRRNRHSTDCTDIMAKFSLLIALALLLNSAAVFGAVLPEVEARSELVASTLAVERDVPAMDLRSVLDIDEVAPLETRKHHQKAHHKSHKTSIKSGKVTYYSGQQLKNPRCPGHKNPNDDSMIAAVSADSPFNCGDKVKITDHHSGKHAVVTVIDRCAGCSADWIDVTKGVFRKMAPLDKGVIHGVSMTMA